MIGKILRLFNSYYIFDMKELKINEWHGIPDAIEEFYGIRPEGISGYIEKRGYQASKLELLIVKKNMSFSQNFI